MPVLVRRFALGLLLTGTSLAAAAAPAPVSAQSCDPAYTTQGISGIVLADPYNDPHGLDGWNYVDDGYGCEGS